MLVGQGLEPPSHKDLCIRCWAAPSCPHKTSARVDAGEEISNPRINLCLMMKHHGVLGKEIRQWGREGKS